MCRKHFHHRSSDGQHDYEGNRGTTPRIHTCEQCPTTPFPRKVLWPDWSVEYLTKIEPGVLPKPQNQNVSFQLSSKSSTLFTDIQHPTSSVSKSFTESSSPISRTPWTICITKLDTRPDPLTVLSSLPSHVVRTRLSASQNQINKVINDTTFSPQMCQEIVFPVNVFRKVPCRFCRLHLSLLPPSVSHHLYLLDCQPMSFSTFLPPIHQGHHCHMISLYL